MAEQKSRKHEGNKGKGKRREAIGTPRYRKPPQPPRVSGPKPNYTPNGAGGAEKKLTLVYNTSVEQLLNGVMDREEYRIGNAEFEKEMFPPFKGAQENDFRCSVRFVGAVEGHELLLSGVQPGTNILTNALAREGFFSKVKSVELQRSLAALHKYLRGHLARTIKEKAKIANPKPAIKPVDASVSSDIKLIWDGNKEGFVESGGIRFRVSTEEVNGHPFRAARVDFAPQGTELADLSGADTYVPVSRLHRPEFVSPLPKGSRGWETQKRIWKFLRGQFAKAGITGGAAKAKPVSVVAQPKPEAKKVEDPYKGSPDIGQLVSGFHGYYVRGEPGARGLIQVRSYTSKASGRERTVVELIRCEAGNFLWGKCKLHTHIPHLWLGKDLEQIEIKNVLRAPDMTMLHIYLTNVIDAHRKDVYESMAGARKKPTGVVHPMPEAIQ